MILRWIAAHAGLSPDMSKMITDGSFEAWCLPQGVISQLWREIAAHRLEARSIGGRSLPCTTPANR